MRVQLLIWGRARGQSGDDLHNGGRVESSYSDGARKKNLNLRTIYISFLGLRVRFVWLCNPSSSHDLHYITSRYIFVNGCLLIPSIEHAQSVCPGRLVCLFLFCSCTLSVCVPQLGLPLRHNVSVCDMVLSLPVSADFSYYMYIKGTLSRLPYMH